MSGKCFLTNRNLFSDKPVIKPKIDEVNSPIK